MKEKHWSFNDAGELEQVPRILSTITAPTKSEALKLLARYGARMIDDPPHVKTRNGAFQLRYPKISGGYNVEAGSAFNRGVCCSATDSEVKDDDASFGYYASEEYQKETRPAA